MKTDYRKKLSSFILCTVLIVAMALPASGCGSKPDSGKQPASGPETETAADGSVLGEGSLQFPFTNTMETKLLLKSIPRKRPSGKLYQSLA